MSKIQEWLENAEGYWKLIYPSETLKYLKKRSVFNNVEGWRSTLLKLDFFVVFSEDFKVKHIFSRTVAKLKILEWQMP